MYKFVVLLGVMLFTGTSAGAEVVNCDQVTDGAWSCPIPRRPAPPPTCHVYGDNLICTAPLDEKKPVNCGWNRAGKYVCW